MPGGDLSIAAGSRSKVWSIDGKDYTAQTLRLRQWAHLEEWSRGKILEEAKILANGLTDRQLAKEVIAEAKAEAKKISITNPGFLQDLQNFEGIQQLFWLSISRAHPNVTLREAGDLVDLNKSLDYMNDFFYLNEAIIQQAAQGDPSGNSQAAAPSTQ